MLHNTIISSPSPNLLQANGSTPSTTKRKTRKPAGTPDPDAEVVCLSPRTLLESDRYVCEICNQGFQRDQNLQMHRRRHKLPWNLMKRQPEEALMKKKRVYVCPEPSCLHHDPCHALGDLVGIKKHFRRKHSSHKEWVCDKCFKAYAVQSDFKAHVKTCGTRGHSCDCGRVFSRIESFIEHQDACRSRKMPQFQVAHEASKPSRTIPLRNDHLNFNLNPPLIFRNTITEPTSDVNNYHSYHQLQHNNNNYHSYHQLQHNNNLELLQLLPSSPSSSANHPFPNILRDNFATTLKLSLEHPSNSHTENVDFSYAKEAREEAKRELEMAEIEFANAKMIRQQAKIELEKSMLLREEAVKKITTINLQVTCQNCKRFFGQGSNILHATAPPGDLDDTSLVLSYMSDENVYNCD